MGLSETLIFYLVVGCVVAVAVYATFEARGRFATGFSLAMAVLFWPLYLPLLLATPGAPKPPDSAKEQPDTMAAAIADVERELDAALANLDGWAESALAREKGRIAELRVALSAQARRIREMDVLLSSVTAPPATNVEPLHTEPADAAELAVDGDPASERCRRSQQARVQNLARLAAVRRQTHSDLMATLAWIRELVSMMHLAKFTGAPAARTEALMAQIAAAVEGVSHAGAASTDETEWDAVLVANATEHAAVD